MLWLMPLIHQTKRIMAQHQPDQKVLNQQAGHNGTYLQSQLSVRNSIRGQPEKKLQTLSEK
jgi:hypothetical protein